MDLVKWKSIRKVLDKDEDIENAVKIYYMDTENKYGAVKDFERPVIITIVNFERVTGGKFVDKFGFSNKLTYTQDGAEKIFDSSSWTFHKAFKDAALKVGDKAMVCTIGFTDPDNGKLYRWWIMQKLGETVRNLDSQEVPL